MQRTKTQDKLPVTINQSNHSTQIRNIIKQGNNPSRTCNVKKPAQTTVRNNLPLAVRLLEAVWEIMGASSVVKDDAGSENGTCARFAL